MKVSAWHSNYDYMREAFTSKDEIPKVELGVTHGLLPVSFEIDEEDVKYAQNRAFEFFNWVHEDFIAPDAVNQFAREFSSHASMSVGDLVQVGDTFWYCASIGWEQLSLNNEEVIA